MHTHQQRDQYACIADMDLDRVVLAQKKMSAQDTVCDLEVKWRCMLVIWP